MFPNDGPEVKTDRVLTSLIPEDLPHLSNLCVPNSSQGMSLVHRRYPKPSQ